jgi:Mrp family chromosome partitioning ATPase
LPSKDKNCTAKCDSCDKDCDSRAATTIIKDPNPDSKVKNVIGVISGKGGVGKSLVTSMLAVTSSRRGNKTAIIEADITGPSIPKIFGLKYGVTGNDKGIMNPAETKTGIKIMSVNLLLKDEKAPVVWRGPVISGTVKQFWTDVVWGGVDYMFVDMPPGTGDVPLTVFQTIPVSGLIVVTTPHELASVIVGKAVNMANMMKIPILGIIENMSYFKCPDCGNNHQIFGESNASLIADEFNLEILAKIPIDPKLSALCDKGMLELMENDYIDDAFTTIELSKMM